MIPNSGALWDRMRASKSWRNSTCGTIPSIWPVYSAGAYKVLGMSETLARQSGRMVIAAALLSLLVAAVAAHNRIPWSDEGWFSSASYNLARHGFLGTTVIDPTDMHLTRIDRRTYWVMPLY